MDQNNKTKFSEDDVKRLQKTDNGKTEKGSLTAKAQSAVDKRKAAEKANES
ncbi:hypothetical protein [Fluviicola taffensis]|uniref:hypothetical protein n=1 Tax=Fluviicola taffensis TaxID=191579 RepID=UPI0031379C7F